LPGAGLEAGRVKPGIGPINTLKGRRRRASSIWRNRDVKRRRILEASNSYVERISVGKDAENP